MPATADGMRPVAAFACRVRPRRWLGRRGTRTASGQPDTEANRSVRASLTRRRSHHAEEPCSQPMALLRQPGGRLVDGPRCQCDPPPATRSARGDDEGCDGRHRQAEAATTASGQTEDPLRIGPAPEADRSGVPPRTRGTARAHRKAASAAHLPWIVDSVERSCAGACSNCPRSPASTPAARSTAGRRHDEARRPDRPTTASPERCRPSRLHKTTSAPSACGAQGELASTERAG